MISSRFVVVVTIIFSIGLVPMALQAQTSSAQPDPVNIEAQFAAKAEAAGQEAEAFHRNGDAALVPLLPDRLRQNPQSILQSVDQASVPMRIAMAQALGNTVLSQKGVEESLLRRLGKDSDEMVRAATAVALHRVGDAWAMNLLTKELLNDPHRQVQENAAWALMKHRTLAARDALWDAFTKEKGAPIKATFAGSLAETGDDRVLPYLLTSLHRDLPFEKGQALRGILGLQREGVLVGERLVSALPPASLDTLDLIRIYPGDVAIPTLRTRLIKEDGSTDLMVLGWLVDRNESEAMASIGPLLTIATDAHQRRSLAQLLPLVPVDLIKADLETWITDADRSVRTSAAIALAQVDASRAASILRQEYENAGSVMAKRTLELIMAKLGFVIEKEEEG